MSSTENIRFTVGFQLRSFSTFNLPFSFGFYLMLAVLIGLPMSLADPRAVAVGNEPVRAGGAIAGRVTSGGYGYAVGASIALAYVPLEYSEPGTPLAVDIFGDWVNAEVRAEPLYDPKGARIRA